jgi:Fe-S-cluster-containing dehydrogenase component
VTAGAALRGNRDEALRRVVLAAPLLRALDARSRAAVWLASRIRRPRAGEAVFAAGAPADSLFVVASGRVEIDGAIDPRFAGADDAFGWDAVTPGGTRSALAVAREESVIAEIPLAALRRALTRSDAAESFVREEKAARERAFARLLSGTEIGAGLSAREIRALVKASREVSAASGDTLATEGDEANVAWLVGNGLVEIRKGEGEPSSFGGRGDFVGLEPALSGRAYGAPVKALADAVLLAIPSEELSVLALRRPAPFEREIAREAGRARKQKEVASALDPRATRLASAEIARLERARSLLVIDLAACVRCGHCAQACADTHGSPRLSRRGDKVTALVASDSAATQRALLLPAACQHCKDPACLPECPTGALLANGDGAVLLREELCTGCGACVSACPYDAIALSPRAAGQPGTGAMVAEKCDLCAGGSGPECVSACPTDAMLRVEPTRDFVDVRALLGRPRPELEASASRRPISALARAALVPPLFAAALVSGSASPSLRFWAGIAAGFLTLLLALHAAVKRSTKLRGATRRWLGCLGKVRGLAPAVELHAGVGVVAASTVLIHTGPRIPSGVAGTLALGFWLLAASGITGAALYALLPPRLARLARGGGLPEDRDRELADLERSLFSSLSGSNEVVQALARSLILPYAARWLGPLSLLVLGRSRSEEEARLAARLRAVLGGHESARLAGTKELVRLAVQLRALGAERLGEAVLRAFVPVHAVLAASVLALLALHVFGVAR